jgi:hypothetical protein
MSVSFGRAVGLLINEEEHAMENDGHLYILWVNDNPITAEKMVFMYGINGLKRRWWD